MCYFDRCSIEERLEHFERLSKQFDGRSVAERKELQRCVLLSVFRARSEQETTAATATATAAAATTATTALHLCALRQRVYLDVQFTSASVAMWQQGSEKQVSFLLEKVLQARQTERTFAGSSCRLDLEKFTRTDALSQFEITFEFVFKFTFLSILIVHCARISLVQRNVFCLKSIDSIKLFILEMLINYARINISKYRCVQFL